MWTPPEASWETEQEELLSCAAEEVAWSCPEEEPKQELRLRLGLALGPLWPGLEHVWLGQRTGQ